MVHIITSVAELEQCIGDIKDSESSAAQRNRKILAILKEQVRVRKKVLNQKVNIVFTHNRKNRRTN